MKWEFDISYFLSFLNSFLFRPKENFYFFFFFPRTVLLLCFFFPGFRSFVTLPRAINIPPFQGETIRKLIP